jgi:predicted transcriptional regulator
MRDVALAVGITERAVQQIVRELVSQGYVEKEKVGRRNHTGS